MGTGAGKGDNIKKIRFWHTWAKVIYSRFSFIAQYYSKKTIFKASRRVAQLKLAHVNTFPAIQLKKPDVVDYSVKFSNELLILIIAVAAAAFNVYFFSGHAYNDKSLAAKFLDNHADLNRKLFAKNNSIVTSISRSGSLFPVAQADDFAGLSAKQQLLDEASADNAILSDGVLAKPNSDSISELIAKQIKVYETQPGDSLGSIAKANGISEQTLMWANNLTSSLIKPGWYLLILPTDGVLHKASNNDTIPDIAKKYGVSAETIVSYNMLDNQEDIEPGQLFIVPGGKMPEPPKPKVTPKPTTPSAPQTTQPKTINSGSGHLFPWGYCTWYVASKVYVPWGGNAKNWLANARAYGAIITSKPAVGAIVVTNENSRYGHVALVEKVTDDSIYVSEMNYSAFGKVDYRYIPLHSPVIKGYIYP